MKKEGRFTALPFIRNQSVRKEGISIMFSEEIVSDLGFYQSWVRVGTMIVVCCLVATIVFRLI